MKNKTVIILLSVLAVAMYTVAVINFCTGGKDMTLGVKADSIIDELSRIIEPTVTIHFTDPSRAVTITPDDPLYQGEEITMLLMPMLVNE